MQKLCFGLFLSALFFTSALAQTFLLLQSYANTDCSGSVIGYSATLSGSCSFVFTGTWSAPICNSTGAFNAYYYDSACTNASSISAVANCSSGALSTCGSLPSGFIASQQTYSNNDCTGNLIGQIASNPACTPTSSGSTTSFRVICPTYQACTDSACMTCPVAPVAPVAALAPYAPVSPCNTGVLSVTPTCPAVPTATTPGGGGAPGTASGSSQLAPAALLLAASLVVLA